MNISAKVHRPRHKLVLVLAGLLIGALTTWAQPTPATPPPAAATPVETDEETIVLSPFEVDASQNIGYYAENTLAGSRLNTNIGDLAASITVVTKQQLDDTASLDINDVFMYEAGTEGANTYTQTTVTRNGYPRDTLAGYSADNGDPSGIYQANRIRGLDTADAAWNNYPAINRVPFDAYNTNSLEISRGPNSLLFGTGSPAGIVNQSTSQATLDRTATQISLRAGSWGAHRASLSHNQPIIDDKLAVFFALLYDEKGFARKPSSDVTRRQYGSLTFKPFPKTKISANVEHFDNFNNRPNFQTPRDYVTPWLNAGRPSYNAMTRMVTIRDTGQVLGPYRFDTRSALNPNLPAGSGNTGVIATHPVGNTSISTTTSPLYVPGMQLGVSGSNRPFITTNQGAYLNAWQFRTNVWTTGTTSALAAPYLDFNAPAVGTRTLAQWAISDRYYTSSRGPVAPTGYSFYPDIAIGPTQQDLYNWESINLLQMNYGTLDEDTFNIEVQQEILSNLNFSAGWFKQKLDAVENYTVSNANAITTLYVDTNEVLPDGSPNPFFGSPFLYDIQPDTFKTPEWNESYRAMLAYELDLTKQDGMVRWLGRHRILGLWSEQEATRSTYRYRYSFDNGDLRWQGNATAANTIVANANVGRGFYVGQNDQGVVEYAPGRLGNPGYGGPETVTARVYNWTTGTWDSSDLHTSQNLFYAGKYGPEQKIITGKSVALQSFFWDDRIVGTFGWRKDDWKARKTDTSGRTTTNSGLDTDLYVNGLAIDPAWTYDRLTPWTRLSGTTRTSGVVVKPLRWEGGELSVHYNKSDNFNPPAGIPVDFFGNPLPKATGEGEDYGFGVSAFDNKLVARLSWFDSTNVNAPGTSAGTAIGRITRADTSNFRSWATYVVRIMAGQNPQAPNFNNNTQSPLTSQMKADIDALMQVPAGYSFDNWPPPGISGTQTNNAKGIEMQVIYNPKQNWNIKVTGTKLKATYQDVAPEIEPYVGDASTVGTRMNVWTQATVPASFPTQYLQYTDSSGTPISLQNFWSGYGFNADARLSNASSNTPDWTSPAGFWESAVQSEINVARALQDQTVPNEREWSFNVISNYAFQEGRLKGLAVGGAIRWASKAIAGFYGDTVNLNSAGLIAAPDLDRPIYEPAETHLDAWVSYTMRVFNDKTKMKTQLNIRDLTESGGLIPIVYAFDGTPAQYRIVDPRQMYITVTFDF